MGTTGATRGRQIDLFSANNARLYPPSNPLTFARNMDRPVHRWFRYSAGFSAEWAESTITTEARQLGKVRVLDPFAGSATTLIAAQTVGIESWGIEAHPFVCRIAEAKLAWRTDPNQYLQKVHQAKQIAFQLKPSIDHYPVLIGKCYDKTALERLDLLRRAYEEVKDETPASKLLWITLLAIVRKVSHVGTAQWQYVLPNHRKRRPMDVGQAFEEAWRMVYADLMAGQSLDGPHPILLRGDARTCEGLPSGSFNLVITSPPYPNNYDYADATRLEMSFLGEIDGWGNLHEAVRRHLICSCSQHVPEKSIDLASVLSLPELEPIRSEIASVCADLAEIRLAKGGRKTYHLMVACYFRDLAQTWIALRRVCKTPSRLCFVIGDSAPYGVYVPVVPWIGRLAEAAGFRSFTFRKTRDRNVKWKNRKHRVPLVEGELWVEG
jgi:hypothetical protein